MHHALQLLGHPVFWLGLAVGVLLTVALLSLFLLLLGLADEREAATHGAAPQWSPRAKREIDGFAQRQTGAASNIVLVDERTSAPQVADLIASIAAKQQAGGRPVILHALTPRTRLASDVCGHTPQLIEARGRVRVDPRLIGRPASQFHVECAHCQLATTPVYAQGAAEALWNLTSSRAQLHPITALPALRLAAESALAAAA